MAESDTWTRATRTEPDEEFSQALVMEKPKSALTTCGQAKQGGSRSTSRSVKVCVRLRAQPRCNGKDPGFGGETRMFKD